MMSGGAQTRYGDARLSSRLSDLRPQDHADARNGVKQSRRGPVLFEFSSQPVDHDAEFLARWSVVMSPHLSEDRRRGHDRARAVHQVVEQPEFSRGQVKQPALLLRAVLRAVHKERTRAKNRATGTHVIARTITTDVRADSSDELPVTERLDEVIIGSRLQTADFVVVRVSR